MVHALNKKKKAELFIAIGVAALECQEDSSIDFEGN